MPKSVSASEAKNNLGAITQWSIENGEEVIIENHGQPTVVLMPYTMYTQTKELLEQERRRQALAQLEALREQVRARNQDLSDDEAEAIANRFAEEFTRELAERHAARYKK